MRAILIDSDNMLIRDIEFNATASKNYRFLHEKCSGVKYVPMTSNKCEMILIDLKKRKYLSGFNFKGKEEFFVGNGILVGFRPNSMECIDTTFTVKKVKEKVLFKKLDKWCKGIIEYDESGLINKNLLNYEQFANYMLLWGIVCKNNPSWKKYTSNINIADSLITKEIESKFSPKKYYIDSELNSFGE